jgi:hypothetical protein
LSASVLPLGQCVVAEAENVIGIVLIFILALYRKNEENIKNSKHEYGKV